VIRISGIGKAYRSSAVAGVQGANFAFYIRDFEQKAAKVTKTGLGSDFRGDHSLRSLSGRAKRPYLD
jgi:hypothetical protein